MSYLPDDTTKTGPDTAAASATAAPTTAGDDVLYCANHPDRETLLRCNRCNKPICLDCAVQTDVGYRCKECIRGVQNKYFNAESRDYPIAFLVAMIVTAIAAPLVSLLIGRFGFLGLIIALFAGSAAGGALAQIIRSSVGKRRGRYLRHAALGGIIFGLFLGSGLLGIIATGQPAGLIVGVLSVFNLPMLLFTILASATAFQLLR